MALPLAKPVGTVVGRPSASLVLLGLVVVLGLAYAAVYRAGEPFFNNDESRHVMTAVFFRDLLADLPIGNLREYTMSYYLQYPGLGLIVWPPFFYLVNGVFMLVFGTSITVSKILVGIFAAVACAYLFQLTRRTHDVSVAAAAVLIFAFSPLVFLFSRYVMLEVPALACGLAATYHFVRYLDLERRRDLILAALAAALTALTRFDGVYLLPLFVILVVVRKRLAILRRRDVLVAAALALALVVPYYGLATMEIGWLRFKQTVEAGSLDSPGFLSARRLLFYPARLPSQIGWFAVVPAVAGLLSGLTAARRARSWPYLAIAAATYVTFTAIVQMESRHVIYWVPAFAVFAADGIALIAGRLGAPALRVALALAVVWGTAWTSFAQPRHSVRGYEEAARFVLSNSASATFCLFDGDLNGNFVYQIRRHDPDRRVWVLRGDKLFFSSLGRSYGDARDDGYVEHAKSDADFLATIFKYDPEFIVVEETRAFSNIPIADRFKAVLAGHPDRFRLETVIPIQSTEPGFRGGRLRVYRSTLRNENPERTLEVEIPTLRRSVRAVVPSEPGGRRGRLAHPGPATGTPR